MSKIHALIVGALMLVPVTAAAQSYPERQVRVIVPHGAGGGTDIVARLLAEKLTERWNQPVVVENRPGGNASIGAQYVVRSDADGHTIMVGAGGVVAINPWLYSDMGFSPSDLQPVTLLATAPYLMAVNPELVPSESLEEFIGFAKEQDGALSWASTSAGSPDHLAGALMQMEAGFEMSHIPYSGGAEALVDLLGGRVELGFFTIPASLPYVQSGQLRALGVSDTQRSPLLPDTPTIDEAGISGYEMLTWYGVWVPSGTPEEVVKEISAGFSEVLEYPDIQERLTASGFASRGSSPEEFTAFVERETAKFGNVISAIGLEPQ